jgi:hypothetical protein
MDCRTCLAETKKVFSFPRRSRTTASDLICKRLATAHTLLSRWASNSINSMRSWPST